MSWENIDIRLLWPSTYYRRAFTTLRMSIDGGQAVHFKLENDEQLLLECSSPGWVEITLFLLSLTIPGERVEGQAYLIRLARRELRRVLKKTTSPDILSEKCNKYY